MKMLRSVIAAVAMLGSTPVLADASHVGQVGDWGLYSNFSEDAEYSSCTVIATYESEEMLMVMYYPKQNRIAVNFQEKDATSVKEGEEKTLGIVFRKGTYIDDGWGTKTFTASIDSDGFRSFNTLLNATDFLADFSSSDYIYFTYNGKPFTGFNLKGTSRAVVALKECAYKMAGINPLDPFIK